MFHTGDYIYEDRADGGRNPALVRQHNSQEIFTVVDYRNRYALYKSDRNLIAAHASAPFVMAWDDHEVDNDYAGTAEEHDTPPEIFLLRRAAAYQAYYENMPVRHDAFPTGPNMRMYRRLKFGTLMDMNVLDTRQYRSDQACGGGVVTGCAAAADPARTMLGAEQERWLFEQLPTVRAKWTVIAQQVPMFARDAAGANPQAQTDGQMGRLHCRPRPRVHAPQGDQGAQPDRSVGRRAHALRVGSENGFPESRFGNDRRRIHQHVDHLRQRWNGCRRYLGSDSREQSARQVSQRAAWLHRLHGYASHDAGRFQDSRPRHDPRPADQDRGDGCR